MQNSHSRSQQGHHVSWHNQSPEKRPLRRHKPNVGGQSQESPNSRVLNSGHPDVYPQDPKQEEDKMTETRLQQGYKIPVPQIEYESLVITKNPRLSTQEDGFLKASKWIVQIMQKKNDLNVVSLDKRKIKEGTLHSFAHANNSGNLKGGKEHQKFFEDLARGTKSLQSLNKRFPFFKRKDECMEYIYSCKVPIQKAIWFFKMSQVAHGAPTAPQNKQKKTSLEQYSADQTKLIAKYFRDVLKRFQDSPQVESSPLYQRWPYFICLFKHSFEEGIVDRHEFLSDISDFPNEYIHFTLEKPQIFRMLILFLSQFVDVIIQNVFLARKVAYMITSRLRIYKKDCERKKGSISNARECFNDLIHCQHHRTLVLSMLGLLHAIIIDCPVALVWNSFDDHILPQQLCGSPLDLLPFSPDVLTQHLPKSAGRINDIIRMRISEIKKRSRDVENRWALTPNCQSGFESIVDVCLNILAALDATVLNSPKALLNLYHNIFCAEPNEKVQQDLVIRIRLLLNWAVSTEREGTYRVLVVCHLLQMRKRHYRGTAFGTHQLQDLLIDYLNKEAPTPHSVHFRQEFASLMLLFYELQRFNLFNHDAYVRALMRYGQFSYQEPVLKRLQHFMQPADLPAPTPSQPSQHESLSTITNFPVKTTELGEQHPAIISFIPTTSSSQPVYVNAASTAAVDSKAMSPNEETEQEYASLLPLPDHQSSNPQLYMEQPVELSAHERFLIHIPIEQKEESRDTCNQRSILLYGISDERELARQELRKIALQICRIWQRKLNVEFFHNSKEVRFKRRVTTEVVGEALNKFKSQTYHDQLVICGWCTESLLEMFKEFFQCTALVLPTSECLDILCSMLVNCGDMHGMLTLTVELIPKLIRLERMLATFHSDCMPGTIACQLAYVLVGYLADNFYYFLYSNEASTILNGLYRVVEKELCAVGYPITGWARAIAIFAYHTRSELLNAQLNDQPLLGANTDVFKQIFPDSGSALAPEDLKYNSFLLTDFLKEPRRFYCYHDYKLHLPSIEDPHTRYSFVVNAFVAARNCKKDYDRLAELSNICGHVSVQKPMAGEWCVAVQELCYSSLSVKSSYSHLIREINVNDPSTHYSLSAFVVLLASKYCFSTHALLLRLLNNVLIPIIKTENMVSLEGSEMGLCLALQIIASIVCGSDVPFHVNCELEDDRKNSANQTHKTQSPKKLLEMRNSDLRALKIVHIRELDACIFPLLSAVAILMDMLKKKIDQSSGSSHNPSLHRLNCLHSVVKCSLLAMCEEEWVISRVFRICETQKNMDAFNCSRLKDDIGQLLLRIALRRRNERSIKENFLQLRGDEAIKKARFDKLLSSMSLWNMRATFYDFKLMIKEISPHIPQKSSSAVMVQAHHERSFRANLFIADIGKYCKDLFVNCRREDYYRGPFSQSTFRFHHINCYWLIAPLISVCPKPDNIPQMVNGSMTVTVKAKFLDEAASILDGVNGTSTQLLGQQPFLNLILTCIQGEEIDNLVGSLLRHIQAIIAKAKENTTLPYQSQFAVEREGLLLRLNLVGGIFDSLLQSTGSSEPWALALFQLMFYEIIAADRDKQYFDVCFDMLSTLVHSMYTSSNSQSAYNGLVRKIRKELGDRPIPSDLNCLAQLLPITKSRAELTAWESFSSANSPQKTSSKTGAAGSTNFPFGTLSMVNSPQPKATRLDKHPQLVQRQLMRLLYHSHYMDYPAPGVLGAEYQQQQRVDKDIYLQSPSVDYYMPERGEEEEALMSPSSNNPSNIGHPLQQVGQSIFPSPSFSSASGQPSLGAQSESAMKTMKSNACFMMLQGVQKEQQQQQHQFDSAHMHLGGGIAAAPPMPAFQQQQQPPPQMNLKFEVGAQPQPQQQQPKTGQQTGLPSHLLTQQTGMHLGLLHPNQPINPHPMHHHSSSMDPSTSSMFTNHQPGGMAAAAVAGFLHQGMHQDQQQRSGSSTPTILGGGPSTSSPQKLVGRGGGRRKNPATAAAGPAASTGRGQKRKKLETGPSKGAPQMENNLMGIGHPGGPPPALILQQQQQASYMAVWQHQQMQQGQGHAQQQQQFIGQQQQFQQQQRTKQQQQQKQQMMGAGGMVGPHHMPQPHMQQAIAGMMSQPDVANQMHHQQQQGQIHASDSKHNLQQKILQRMSAQQQHQGGGNPMQM